MNSRSGTARLARKALWVLVSVGVGMSAGCGNPLQPLQPQQPLQSPAAEEAFPGRTGTLREALLLSGPEPVAVTVEEIDGQFVLDGDMIVDRSELQLLEEGESAAGVRRSELATVIGSKVWPSGLIPYRIETNLTDVQRVHDAIAHWEAKTVLRFVPRTNEADYVTFRPSSSGCSATVGRVGGQQFVSLGNSCGTGSTMHEIGHAIGLYHVQARSDRDANVVVHWANITTGKEHNFRTYIERNLPGADVGPYDIGSLMHYGSSAFSSNGSPTLTRLDGTTFTANRAGLSVDDIDSVAQIYGYPDDTPPTVKLTSPSGNTTLRGHITLAAEAMDNQAVARVEFWRTGTLIAAVTSPPWTTPWDTTSVPDGTYALYARAFDKVGNDATSFGSQVKVHNIDLAPPEVTLLSPTAESVVLGEVVIVATAVDDFEVVEIDFLVDGSPIWSGPWPREAHAWDSTGVPNGPVTLRIEARDAAGNVGTSGDVVVQVENPDITPPQVTLTTPSPDDVLAETVVLTAEATDETGVVAVTFFSGERALGTVTTAPWSLSWDTLAVENGPVALRAEAEDAAGNRTSSHGVTATVMNRPPAPNPEPEGKAGRLGLGCAGAPSGLPLWPAVLFLLPVVRRRLCRR